MYEKNRPIEELKIQELGEEAQEVQETKKEEI
jgi:hypothetical protein